MIVHLTSGDNSPAANEMGLNKLKIITERAEQKNVFDQINSDKSGFCFDSGHQNYRSKNVDLLSMYGDKLMALHLHDNDESADQHRLPFDGNINWEGIMKQLKMVNYNGPIALEAMNTGYEHISNPEEFLKIAFDRAKN